MAKKRIKKNPILVGITGGIGSGKSTVCRVFEWLNVKVYYADSQAISIINDDPAVKEKIKALLGSKSYVQNKYNRRYVADQVFKNKALLNQLNSIVHPAVAADFQNWIKLNKKEVYLLKEAAILFESGAYKEMDKIICVTAPTEVRINRVLKRDKTTRKSIVARIKNQMTDAAKIKRSDYIVENDGSKHLISQIIGIHKLILQKS